jgi:2-amino-4-hydroxy-6-hydroxymethyldihydropteridine diphosphokinase
LFVIKIEYAIALAFKQILTDIEKAQGRDRANQASKYGPLPLDMDILLWGENAFNYGEKPHYVPDKGIVKYAAVAVPLAEIAPDVVHPLENVTIAEIAASFDGTDLPIKTTYTIT